MGEIAILTKEHLAWRRSQGGDGGSGGIWGMGMATLWVLSWFYHGFCHGFCHVFIYGFYHVPSVVDWYVDSFVDWYDEEWWTWFNWIAVKKHALGSSHVDLRGRNCGRSVALQGLRPFLRRAAGATRSPTTETQQGRMRSRWRHVLRWISSTPIHKIYCDGMFSQETQIDRADISPFLITWRFGTPLAQWAYGSP